jgi:hypothetical protein
MKTTWIGFYVSLGDRIVHLAGLPSGESRYNILTVLKLGSASESAHGSQTALQLLLLWISSRFRVDTARIRASRHG